MQWPWAKTRELDPETRAAYAGTAPGANENRTVFDVLKCLHCGGIHMIACPRVKRMVFNAGGAIAEVEFWADGSWSREGIIWPDQVFVAPPPPTEPEEAPSD